MYNIFKKFIRFLLPKNTLFKNEDKIRSIIFLLYKGNKYSCPICEKHFRCFITLKDGDKLCPYCGSLARDRRLWQVVKNEFLVKETRILDFSPSRCLYKRFKREDNISYFSTDISGDFLADYNYDITNLNTQNNMFDLVICYHILEHIENDIQAMKELFRILKNKGICLIQTPFKEGDIFENSNITSKEGRLINFGQADHVRIYSLNGIKKRLISIGFQVEIRSYTEQKDNKYGFKINEHILICLK